MENHYADPDGSESFPAIEVEPWEAVKAATVPGTEKLALMLLATDETGQYVFGKAAALWGIEMRSWLSAKAGAKISRRKRSKKQKESADYNPDAHKSSVRLIEVMRHAYRDTLGVEYAQKSYGNDIKILKSMLESGRTEEDISACILEFIECGRRTEDVASRIAFGDGSIRALSKNMGRIDAIIADKKRREESAKVKRVPVSVLKSEALRLAEEGLFDAD